MSQREVPAQCSHCGHGARTVSLPQLARTMHDDTRRLPTTAAGLRARGRAIAADLGLRIVTAGGYEFIVTADLDAALTRVTAEVAA